MTPWTTHTEKDDDSERVISFGQHNSHDPPQLHGIGRKIGIWKDGIHIVEGSFKNDLMTGFARTISFKWTGDYIVTMGNFNEKE